MQKEIIEKMELYISDELYQIEHNRELTKEQKIEAYNVLYNTYKFLKNYDKNVQILQKNVAASRYERGE